LTVLMSNVTLGMRLPKSVPADGPSKCGPLGRGLLIRNPPYARAREGVTRKQQESEPEPSVTEPLLLTVATDSGDESRGVRVDCAAHAVAKDSRSRALISSNLGRPRRRCATRALNLSGGWLCSPPGRRPRWRICPGPGPVRSARDADWGPMDLSMTPCCRCVYVALEAIPSESSPR